MEQGNIDLNDMVVDENPNEGAGDMTEPNEGMAFESGSEFAQFCHVYAYNKGFMFFTRNNRLMREYKEKGVSRKGVGDLEAKPHMMEEIRLKCKFGGQEQSTNSYVSGCKVFVYARIIEGKMVITRCWLHNHPLDPKSSQMMVNYRGLDDPTFDRMMINDQAGIPIVQNFTAQVIENEGHENLTFNERDVRNAVNVARRRSRIQGDAKALEDYFERQRKFNSQFYSSMQRDDEGRLLNVFWSDARSRALAKDFGDIITFDTTFRTNRYRMPFAPFVGVNHHGKTVIFASCLISHEDAQTFVWVFQQWMECMGKKPMGILADQCKAIGKAVETVFPDVPHRLYLWHILRNAHKNLGRHPKWKEIDVAMRTAVHDFLEPDEFDEAWTLVMQQFRLQTNAWMNEAFEIRRRWAPGLWRSTFWAGMSSTQRSEQTNRFVKISVNIVFNGER